MKTHFRLFSILNLRPGVFLTFILDSLVVRIWRAYSLVEYLLVPLKTLPMTWFWHMWLTLLGLMQEARDISFDLKRALEFNCSLWPPCERKSAGRKEESACCKNRAQSSAVTFLTRLRHGIGVLFKLLSDPQRIPSAKCVFKDSVAWLSSTPPTHEVGSGLQREDIKSHVSDGHLDVRDLHSHLSHFPADWTHSGVIPMFLTLAGY